MFDLLLIVGFYKLMENTLQGEQNSKTTRKEAKEST